MKDPSLVAFSVAIGGVDGTTFPFPHGANVVSPADLFLTVHGTSTGMVAELVHAGTNALVAGPSPTATVDTARHQVEVRIPTTEWNPGTGVVRLAMGVGLWNQATGAYLLPAVTQSTTTPGGAGTVATPAAFFNVAFRSNAQEPMPDPRDPANTATNPAWWRDQAQGAALAAGDITAFHASVDFSKLAARATDNSGVPVTGPMDRILASHFQTAPGNNYAVTCFPGPSTVAPTAPVNTRATCSRTPIYVPRKGSRTGIRHDPAAALARRQLQPVPEQPQPVAVR